MIFFLVYKILSLLHVYIYIKALVANMVKCIHARMACKHSFLYILNLFYVVLIE